jgi:hypothetical protein
VSNQWSNAPAFSENVGKGDPFVNWFNDGVQGGYYYKAWYLILENHLAFAPLFKAPEQETFEDLKTFFDQIKQDNVAADEGFERGFKRLHDYINKNVHEDVRADLPTMQVRERNLSNWKVQLEYNEGFNSERWKQKTVKIISHITEALNLLQSRIKAKKLSSQETKTARLTAPIIACFCNLANASGLILKGITENNETYCKRVCTTYNLQYTDRVRQGFSGANSNKNVNNVTNLILPNIPEADRERINKLFK